ncbi:MAG: CAP domain-containing protein [Nitrososphaeria archaeon]
MRKEKVELLRYFAPVLVGILVIVVFFTLVNPYIESLHSSYTSTPTKATYTTFTNTDNVTTTILVDPIRSELVSYALEVINHDRETFGLASVELGDNIAAQKHSEDLVRLSVLSHWGADGMKPYMRYSVYGGKNYVQENVGVMFLVGKASPPSVEEMKSYIRELEHEMIYNDSAANWGHRDNILDPAHTHVNIGIDYTNNMFVMVQDFENVYINWNVFEVNDTQVTLDGSLLKDLEAYLFVVFYDPLPEPLTREQLLGPPYNNGYFFGEKIGAVLNKGYEVDIPYVYATKWYQSGLDFSIEFDLSPFVQKDGVYTILFEVIDEKGQIYYATAYSIFIKK